MELIQVGKSADAVFIQAHLRAHLIAAEEGGYVVHCPSLDIFSQGETIREARANIKEAIELVIEASFERGTLAKRLAKSGFVKAGRTPRKKQRKLLAADSREILVPAKIPLMAAA